MTTLRKSVNSAGKNIILFLFLFILIGSLGLGFRYSNAGTNQSLLQNRTLFTSENETFPVLGNQTIQSTLSELIPPESQNDTNQFTAILPEQLATNRTLTTAPSNESARIANLRAELNKLPENTSKAEVENMQRQLLANFGPANLLQNYRVTVTFDSITIHEDYDHCCIRPAVCCSGEWSLAAFVQGKGINLLYSNTIDDGDTINFPPGTALTVDISNELPISILTIGNEDDYGFLESCTWYGIPLGGCGFCAPGGAVALAPGVAEILEGPVSTWADTLHQYQVEKSRPCHGDGDRLGYINKFYNAPDYGAGPHTNVVSSNGDFTLRYTITVQAPQVGPVEPGVECGNPLHIKSVKSSPNLNTFPPSNAIDNNFNTKWWSTNSLNPYITVETGSTQTHGQPTTYMCGIDIAWADGNLHPYRFAVSVSNDGTNFVNAFSGTSTGTTTFPESYEFPEVQGRFVKVTITESTHGSLNSIAQISELKPRGSTTIVSLCPPLCG